MTSGNEKQRVTVTIYGQQYTIVGQAPPSHVRDVAQIVDQKMKEIKKRNPYLDTTSLAVLTAINVADDYKKLLKKNEVSAKALERERTTGDE
ncbi:cell division protein ZapA [bacterium LRH843]|nr:cell division protein ZapA [bacterium LRH843]